MTGNAVYFLSRRMDHVNGRVLVLAGEGDNDQVCKMGEFII